MGILLPLADVPFHVKRFVMPLLATVLGAALMGTMLSRGCTKELPAVKGRVDMVEANADPELAAPGRNCPGSSALCRSLRRTNGTSP
jgi:ribonucleotide monophosphatase NagD (HAD superfamily)